MSIAEMINQGTERQSQSWSILAKNLGDLGREVGNQLALQQYQKQAAEALPAMQAAYKSAMDDVTAGSVTQGYKKFMDAQFQFGTSQNPFIAQANEAAGTIFQNATTMYEKQQQRKAQYGGGVAGPSGLDRLRGGTIVEPVSLPVLSAQEASPEQAIASYEDQTRYGSQTFDMDEEPYDTDLREAQIAEQIQNNPDLTKEQKQFAPQVLQHRKDDPVKKTETLNQSTTETVDTGFEKVKVSGLEKIYPNLTGEIGIPKVGTITKIKETIATSDAPGSKINYTYTPVEKEVGESLYNHNMETYKKMGKSVTNIINQAPIDSKEKFVNLFEKNGGIENAVVSPTSDKKVFNLFFNGNDKDQYEITAEQAQDIGIVQSIPATSGSGIRFVGTPKPAAPAPTGGTQRISLEEIARGGAAPAAAPTAQPSAAPAAQAAPVLSKENPFAEQAKADAETAKTVKAVQEKMATEARRITETREAKKELEKVNQEIARLNEPRKGASPMMAGLKLSEAKATEKAIEWEKLNTKKKQLERLLSSR